jgi:hypothetical protein
MAEKSYSNEADLDSEGIPGLNDSINVDEGIVPPRDHPIAATAKGVTAAEERRPESLEERMKREQPEITAEDIVMEDEEGRPLEARLINPGDEDVDAIDTEKDSVAFEASDGETGLSAEEAAMHITTEP